MYVVFDAERLSNASTAECGDLQDVRRSDAVQMSYVSALFCACGAFAMVLSQHATSGSWPNDLPAYPGSHWKLPVAILPR